MGLPLVVIVGADKGGVGKTMIARALMDWFRAQGMDARAFDTQVPGGVLKRFHPAKTDIVDLTASDGQMAVFDTLNRSAVTVLDLAAGLLTPTLAMLRETGFVSMVAEGRANIAVLHVVSSSVASLAEVSAIAGAVEGLKLFVVTNPIGDAVIAPAALNGATVIPMPKLNDRAFQLVDSASLPFAEFAGDARLRQALAGECVQGAGPDAVWPLKGATMKVKVFNNDGDVAFEYDMGGNCLCPGPTEAPDVLAALAEATSVAHTKLSNAAANLEACVAGNWSEPPVVAGITVDQRGVILSVPPAASS